MKVCFISEAQSIHTQRWTKGLVQAGCEIHLISSSNVRISGVELHHLPIYSANPFAQIRNIIRIRRLIHRLKPDVIHLFGLFSVNSLGSMWLIKSWPTRDFSLGKRCCSPQYKRKHERKVYKELSSAQKQIYSCYFAILSR